MKAICFYSDRSDDDWYKYDLELLVERHTQQGSEFEKHEYLSVVLSKDMTKPLLMLTHEFGTANLINHWARTVEELVNDYQQGIHHRKQYQFVPINDYRRLRQQVLELIDRHKQMILPLSAYENVFTFEGEAKQLNGPTLQLPQPLITSNDK